MRGRPGKGMERKSLSIVPSQPRSFSHGSPLREPGQCNGPSLTPSSNPSGLCERGAARLCREHEISRRRSGNWRTARGLRGQVVSGAALSVKCDDGARRWRETSCHDLSNVAKRGPGGNLRRPTRTREPGRRARAQGPPQDRKEGRPARLRHAGLAGMPASEREKATLSLRASTDNIPPPNRNESGAGFSPFG